jgi:hypothetical protein
MKIKTITAARLINTGNYENTRFEATAELAEGEDLAAASRDLQLALVAQIRAERDRRYPELEGRRWAMWVEEDERAEA